MFGRRETCGWLVCISFIYGSASVLYIYYLCNLLGGDTMEPLCLFNEDIILRVKYTVLSGMKRFSMHLTTFWSVNEPEVSSMLSSCSKYFCLRHQRSPSTRLHKLVEYSQCSINIFGSPDVTWNILVTFTHQCVGVPHKHRLHRDPWDKGT